jgi:hypothetical protein
MCDFLVQILATEIQTNFNNSPNRMSPNYRYAEKRKKHVPKIG